MWTTTLSNPSQAVNPTDNTTSARFVQRNRSTVELSVNRKTNVIIRDVSSVLGVRLCACTYGEYCTNANNSKRPPERCDWACVKRHPRAFTMRPGRFLEEKTLLFQPQAVITKKKNGYTRHTPIPGTRRILHVLVLVGGS